MPSKRPKLKKRFKYIILSLTIIFTCSFFGSNWAIVSNAEGKLFSKIDDCPKVKVGLVLGTSKVGRNNNPNPYFTNRIEAAAQLFHAGKVSFLLVSGDNSVVGYDEPTDMKFALIAAGVPENRIFLDYAGFRTLDSMERTLKVFGQNEVIVISQHFHNERAIYLGEHFDMKVYGFDAKDVSSKLGFKTKIRERFARMKVFWDILFSVNAKFLGEEIIIN